MLPHLSLILLESAYPLIDRKKIPITGLNLSFGKLTVSLQNTKHELTTDHHNYFSHDDFGGSNILHNSLVFHRNCKTTKKGFKNKGHHHSSSKYLDRLRLLQANATVPLQTFQRRFQLFLSFISRSFFLFHRFAIKILSPKSRLSSKLFKRRDQMCLISQQHRETSLIIKQNKNTCITHHLGFSVRPSPWRIEHP